MWRLLPLLHARGTSSSCWRRVAGSGSADAISSSDDLAHPGMRSESEESGNNPGGSEPESGSTPEIQAAPRTRSYPAAAYVPPRDRGHGHLWRQAPGGMGGGGVARSAGAGYGLRSGGC
jgi:hypothetical protein